MIKLAVLREVQKVSRLQSRPKLPRRIRPYHDYDKIDNRESSRHVEEGYYASRHREGHHESPRHMEERCEYSRHREERHDPFSKGDMQ